MSRLVLWDIDGTLIRGGMAGRHAFADAVAEVLGLEIGEEHLPRMSGKTDPQIALEILAAHGYDDARLPEVTRALETALLARGGQLRAEGRVLPGVREAIAALADAAVLQSLLTGNMAANARTKLAILGLLPEGDSGGPVRLDLGAYADDSHDRDGLVPIALARAAGAGFDVDPSRTWVVGDTPRDLACARAGGVRCLLVATGTYPLEDLRALDPDAAMADLSDTRAVVAALTG